MTTAALSPLRSSLTRPSRMWIDAVGDRGRARVVADDERRHAFLAGELGEERVDGCGAELVELAGRLVGDQEPRPVRERRAERDALLLAARELARDAHPRGRAGRPARGARALGRGAPAPGRPAGRAGPRSAPRRSARRQARASSAGRRTRASSPGSRRGDAARARRARRPATSMLPALGRSKPASTRISVVLPEPLGPRTTQISPSSTSSVRPCSAATPPSAPG